MPLVETEAIVLHAFDYSETSRILRIATRDAGVQSVLARGARRSKSRFGSAVDLFAQGHAELHLREGRDLQTLSAFDVTRARAAIADDLGRFTGASMVAEIMLRFGAADDSHSALFDALSASLDRIERAAAERASEAGLAGAWRLLAELGFAPSLPDCSSCHTPLDPAAVVAFHHSLGGALCASCAARHPGGRALPPDERARIAAWCVGDDASTRVLSAKEAQAHQRLLREFLEYHLSDDRSLRAFAAWEHGHWGDA
jgi:DNA repair protein RecO (recombination protein O)